MDFRALRSVFANANFLHYIYGNSFSQFGIWVQRVAVAWLTWELTQSPFWLGLMAFADFAPSVVCAPLAGAIADRVDRLRGIKITQAIGGLQCVALVVLTGTGAITVEILLGLTFLLGVVMAFNQPLRLAVIPSLVGAKDMSAAVSVNSLTFNIARITGPAIAGLTILHFGIAPCFAICALSYFIFVFALLSVRVQGQIPRGQRRTLRDLPAEIMAGIHYCRSHAGIGPVMVLMAIVAIAGRSYTELLPGFAAEVFDRGADGFAILLHVGDDEDLLHPAFTLFAHVLHGCTEMAGEADLIVVADVLVTEAEHTVIEQGLPHAGDLVRRQRLRQVEAADFSAEGGSSRHYLHGGRRQRLRPARCTCRRWHAWSPRHHPWACIHARRNLCSLSGRWHASRRGS